ncbi:RNA-directed DNA polymerase, eukaryota [Tanacetum coccineum]
MNEGFSQPKKMNEGFVKNTFASALNTGIPKPILVEETSPAIVIDDSCLMERDFSCSLIGKIKNINALSNLYIILANKGFENVKLTYVGGLWVLLEIHSNVSKEKISKHVGVGLWFSVLQPACNSFVSDERIVWISIEGLPIKALTHNSFTKIASIWGELTDLEDSENISLSHKKLFVKTKTNVTIDDKLKVIVKGHVHWIHVKELEAWSPKFIKKDDDYSSSDEDSAGDENEHKTDVNENEFELEDDKEVERVSESSCMHVDDNVIKDKENGMVKGSVNAIVRDHVSSPAIGDDLTKANVHSADPFNIYDMLNKNNNKTNQSSEELQHPPSFTPSVIKGGKYSEAILKRITTRMNRHSLCHKTKKEWVKELCSKHRINLVALQETKMENMDLFTIKALWGDLSFDFATSSSVGNLGGILCVSDPYSVVKDHVSSSDYFLAIMDQWEGETVILGDFNEVRTEQERFGSSFNITGANAFNNFISMAGLVDIPLGGFAFTYAHKSPTKMSKLDRFLISEGLMEIFPHLSALCLDRHLSDHRPIITRELKNIDYGPNPFRIFHWWLKMEGFDKVVEDSWKNIDFVEPNRMNVEKIIDQGGGNEVLSVQRSTLIKDLQDLLCTETSEVAQKVKVRWAIEGDENSKYFLGILNNKRSHLAIHGILLDGEWISDPYKVESEFLKHFSRKFSMPHMPRLILDFQFPKQLTLEQSEDLESFVSYDEIKRAVWDCDEDVVAALKDFFVRQVPLEVWGHISQIPSLWTRFITAIYGSHGALEGTSSASRNSLWLDIIQVLSSLKTKGIDLLGFAKNKSRKDISVAEKMSHSSLAFSFRRLPREALKRSNLATSFRVHQPSFFLKLRIVGFGHYP